MQLIHSCSTSSLSRQIYPILCVRCKGTLQLQDCEVVAHRDRFMHSNTCIVTDASGWSLSQFLRDASLFLFQV